MAQPDAAPLPSQPDKTFVQPRSAPGAAPQTPALQSDPAATLISDQQKISLQAPPVPPPPPDTPEVQLAKSDRAPDSDERQMDTPLWFPGSSSYLSPQEPMPALENYQENGQQTYTEHGPHHQPQVQYGPHHQPQPEYGPHHQPQPEYGPHHQPQPEYGPHHQPQAQYGPHHQPQAIHGIHHQAYVTEGTKHVTTQVTRKGIGHVVRHKILGTLVGKIAVGALVAAVAAGAAFAALAPPRAAPAGKITEFPLPTATPVNSSTLLMAGNGPVGIAKGSDGNLWFAEYASNKIGRMTPSGNVTEFPIPTPPGGTGTSLGPSSNLPGEIAAGPDGNIWFTEYGGNKIGRITPSGSITEFPLPTNNGSLYGNEPLGITMGPDGNLWFTEWGYNYDLTTGSMTSGKIGRITPNGDITEFPLPQANSTTYSSYPYGITAGPDGNLWFTESNYYSGSYSQGSGSIGRITPSGSITEFPLPNHNSSSSGNVAYEVYEIATGPDNNLWFTEADGHIARITTSGSITEFSLPTGNTPSATTSPISALSGKLPYGIVAGPDGNLWFTEVLGNQIGRISTSGSVTEFSLSTANSTPSATTTSVGTLGGNWPAGITVGPDGNLWFAEYASNKIGVITS